MMDKSLKAVEVHLDREGQLVIPTALRQLLGFKEGDRLIAHEEAGRLILEKEETIKQRLKGRFAHISKDRNLADELIAERREAAREEMVE
jgi:AbrB family looped-hinge helix DNA binding protein